MQVTVEIDPARRTAAFREVSYLAAGDSCRVVLDGVRGADFGTLKLMLYRDAASESPVASCTSFSQVPNHPSLADGVLALDTSEMAEWFADAVPEESDSDSDSVAPVSQKEPRLAARASLAERSVRAEGWLVAFDSDRVWAACRVPVLLRPGAGTSGASDPSSIRALVSELVAGLVSAALADKADKVPSASAGNLASLDASGNLLDSGATPASIKAAAVAEVVANAPGTMDTLKEIADILGSAQQAGTVLKRILDLETGKASKAEMSVTPGTGANADKTTIQLKNGTSATVLTAHQDMSGKRGLADMAVYEDGFTDWEFSDGVTRAVTVGQCPSDPAFSEDIWGKWALYGEDCDNLPNYAFDTREEAESALQFQYSAGGNSVTATRSRVVVPTQDTLARTSQVPTKTSQLTNDSGFLTSHQDVSGKADKVSGATAGNLASLTAQGNLADSGAKPSDFATPSDLPYALVETGVAYELSAATSPITYYDGDVGAYVAVDTVVEPIRDGGNVTGYMLRTDFGSNVASYAADGSFVQWESSGWMVGDGEAAFPRIVLTGHLLDRAVNAVSATGATVLTLPSFVAGKSRDFYLKMTVTGSQDVTFSPSAGVAYTGFGNPAKTYSAGTYVLRFTETSENEFCVTNMLAEGLSMSAVEAYVDSQIGQVLAEQF